MSARRAGGFTLLEVLGVVLLTSLVLTVMVSFYVNLSQQSTRASETTREVRRAAALLDRVSADLEQTILVRKPEETDALAHPWLFVGESRFKLGGADQLKFVKRESARASAGPASDLAMVAYTLRRNPEDDRTFELRRWSTPELPESLDREFPPADDPDSFLVLDGISHFTVRFMNDEGEWSEEWDSTTLVDASELPVAVAIDVALARDPELDPDDPDLPLGAVEQPLYSRLVELPVRPIDLEVLLEPEEEEAGEGEEEGAEDEGLTVADCVDLSKLPSDIARQVPLDAPFAPYRDSLCGHSAVNPSCC